MSKHDFAGWVTKNDIRCADGVTIKRDAFKHNDQAKVPLVWEHGASNPKNVLGYVVLHNKDKGVYGYGFFNDTEDAQHAKSLVQHGDISSMSISANRVKRNGTDVVHGNIREVSLVLSAANPGALIETIMNHSDELGDDALIYTGTLIHSADDVIIEHAEKETEDEEVAEEKTIGAIMDTLNEEQRQAVELLLAAAIGTDEDDEDIEQSDDTEDEETIEQSDDKGDKLMKNNVFSKQTEETGSTLTHSDLNAILEEAKKGSTLKHAMEESDTLEHGITNIEYLFPEVKNVTNEPVIYRDPNTSYKEILNAATKTPFSRIRTRVADFTEDEARARGYIKGKEKIEQIFPILRRTTGPQTVYKKQKLDRDDIIDITDFDVVRFIEKEMRFMLEEELARAILVGDGRSISDDSKIQEDMIRPVISDHDFYTLKKSYVDASDFVESVVLGMADYYGSGAPTMYMDPTLLAKVKLQKGTDGRWLGGSIPSTDAVATMLGVSKIVPTTFMKDKGAVVVNLRDYNIGSSKGGEITTFDDFDIDFNQYKYLIETRLSGALVLPHAAVYFSEFEADGGDNGDDQ